MSNRELLQQITQVQTQAAMLIERIGVDQTLASPLLQAISRLSDIVSLPVESEGVTPASYLDTLMRPVAMPPSAATDSAEDSFAAMDGVLWKQGLMDVPIGIAILMGPEHQYIFTNRLHDHITSRSGFIGYRVKEVFPELQDQGIISILNEVYRSGKEIRLSEVPIQLLNGGPIVDIVVDVTYHPLYARDGSVWGIFVQVIDIQNRRALTQEWLRNAAYRAAEIERERFHRLLHQSPAAIAMMAGPLHVFTFTNSAYEAIIDERDVIGKPLREAIPEIVDQGFLEILDTVYTSGQAMYKQEIPIRLAGRDDGVMNEFCITLSVVPLIDDQHVTGIFVHGVDVTELVLARQRAEETVRIRDRFLSIAAHELKTPLTSLIGYAQMLRRRLGNLGEMDARTLRALSLILSQGQRLSRLIDTVLEVTRITTGHLSLDKEIIDVRELAAQIVDEVQIVNERRVINLALPDEPCLIAGDSLRLEQVLVNLIQNAIKYSPGGGDVSLSVVRAAEHVQIIVIDQGIGIPESIRAHIFERFYRGDHAQIGGIAGMGIGLSVVYEIVTLHGGTIEVANTDGTGSTFVVQLPLATHHDI